MARMTIDMGIEFENLLNRVARESATTKADVIRRAVTSYAYLKDETKDGKQVAISEKSQIIKEVILP